MRYYKVCLRICGEGLKTVDVTNTIGIEPTKTVSVGDKGALRPTKIPVWMWQARTDSGTDKWDDFEAGVQRVIECSEVRKKS